MNNNINSTIINHYCHYRYCQQILFTQMVYDAMEIDKEYRTQDIQMLLSDKFTHQKINAHILKLVKAGLAVRREVHTGRNIKVPVRYEAQHINGILSFEPCAWKEIEEVVVYFKRIA